MSQIVPYDDKQLEQLCVYARHLRPLLREENLDDDIDISGLELSHYRLKKISEYHLNLKDGEASPGLPGTTGLGSGAAHDPDKEFLSHIIARLNELFGGDSLTDGDRINYMSTIKEKVMENEAVAAQVANNTPDQIMHGDFPQAVQDAVMASMDSHKEMSGEILRDATVAKHFVSLLLDAIFHERSENRT